MNDDAVYMKPAAHSGNPDEIFSVCDQQRCLKRTKKLYRQLQRASKLNYRARYNAQRRWLLSDAVRMTSALKANAKLPSHKRESVSAVVEVAAALDFSCPIPEAVHLYVKRKSSGGYRPIMNFGILRRTAVEVVRPLLSTYFRSRPFQYDQKGIHQAIRDVKAAISDGLVYAQRIDIVNHYGSFDEVGLSKLLPLPKELVDHVAVGKHIPMDTGGSKQPSPMLATIARQGIPQGSGLSPIIASITMSQLDWTAPEGIRLFNYADDFLAMGFTKEGADAAANALSEAIASLPGGHFSNLKRTPTTHAGDGLAFLGHWIHDRDGKIVVSMTATNENALYARLYDLDLRSRGIVPPGQSKKSGPVGLEAACHAWVLTKAWSKAFRECDDVDDHVEFVRSLLESDLKRFDVPASVLDEYKNPDLTWVHSGSAWEMSSG